MLCTTARHARSVAAGLLLSCQTKQKHTDGSNPPPNESTLVETGAHSGDTDSAPYEVGRCPPYAGLGVENPWEAHVTYLVNVPPYQATEMRWEGGRSHDESTEFAIEISSNTNEASLVYLVYPYHFTTKIYLHGWIDARCDEDGYWERGRTLTWTIQDLFDRYTLTTTTAVTWDPPILVVPTDLAPGMTWVIDTTQTTQYASGGTTTEDIHETRTAVRIETVSWSWNGMEDDALLVESSAGQQRWYQQDYGLVRGDGLTAAGGGYGIDDTE